MTPTFNEHNNDIDDWCPWSGEPADESDIEEGCCPALCRASYVKGVE